MRHILWQAPKDPTVQIQLLFLRSNLPRGYSLRGVETAAGFCASFLILLQQTAVLAGKLETMIEQSFCWGCTNKATLPTPKDCQTLLIKFTPLALFKVSKFVFQKSRLKLWTKIFKKKHISVPQCLFAVSSVVLRRQIFFFGIFLICWIIKLYKTSHHLFYSLFSHGMIQGLTTFMFPNTPFIGTGCRPYHVSLTERSYPYGLCLVAWN